MLIPDVDAVKSFKVGDLEAAVGMVLNKLSKKMN